MMRNDWFRVDLILLLLLIAIIIILVSSLVDTRGFQNHIESWLPKLFLSCQYIIRIINKKKSITFLRNSVLFYSLMKILETSFFEWITCSIVIYSLVESIASKLSWVKKPSLLFVLKKGTCPQNNSHIQTLAYDFRSPLLPFKLVYTNLKVPFQEKQCGIFEKTVILWYVINFFFRKGEKH